MKISDDYEKRLDSIGNYISGIGLYGSDAGVAGRPTLDTRLTAPELDYLYLSNDLTRRIVDELVQDALKDGFTARDLKTNDIVEEPDHLDIRDAAESAGINGRLYGGGLIHLITRSMGGQNQPLEAGPGVEIENLVVLDRWEATPRDFVEDIKQPGRGGMGQFGDALNYDITPVTLSGMTPYEGESDPVHWTRLLRFGGARLPRRLSLQNNGYDDSVVQPVWDSVRNFTQSEQAMATIIQRFEQATVSIAGLSESLATGGKESEDLIRKRMQMMHESLSILNAALIDADAGEKYERKYATLTGLDVMWDRFAQSVAKAARMPMTQLFGQSPDGMSTDDQSGKANWRKQITAYQNKTLRPALEWYFTLINGGKPVWIEFASHEETTATEEATIAKMRAETDATYLARGVYSAEEVRQREIDEGRLVDRGFDSPQKEVIPSQEAEDPLASPTKPEGTAANVVPQTDSSTPPTHDLGA